METGRRRVPIVATVLTWVAVFETAHGQIQQQPPTQIIPREHGHWDGPYDLPLTDYPTGEIVHAAVLPPSIGALSGLTAERVVFMARTTIVCNGACTGVATSPAQVYGRSYLWKERDPSNVTPIAPAATYPQDGSQDYFCGGHTFLSDGSWLVVGGDDYRNECINTASQPGGCAVCCRGVDQAWRLDTSTATPQWFAASNASQGNQMGKKRWYPTALTLASGDALVLGHTADPSDFPPGENPYYYRDEYLPQSLPATGTWLPDVVNLPYQGLTGPCTSTNVHVNVHDYARLHLLRNGLVMIPDAATDSYPKLDAPTAFLDVQPQPWSCSEPRWRVNSSVELPQLTLDCGSVHFITWDRATDQFHESVYMIGGGALDIDADCAGSGTVDADFYDMVYRMTDPDPGLATPTPWEQVDHMLYTRANLNAVIGLDGAIYVFGGQAKVSNVCTYRKWAEIYRPAEVFEGVTGLIIGQWGFLAQESDVRQYHSVANLLPSGKIISAGGVSVPNVSDSAHTLEIFTPPYAYTPGAAPVIDVTTLNNPFTSPYHYTVSPSTITFTVTLDTGKTVDRVALVRNGNSTHGFDSSQRYIELRLPPTTPPVEVPPGSGHWNVTCPAPANAATAPPGFYMLSVTDSNQKTSAAEWVRIVP